MTAVAGAVPVQCPPWCEGQHGLVGDPGAGRIEPGGYDVHETVLAEVEDFRVLLAQTEHHSTSGEAQETYLNLFHRGWPLASCSLAHLEQLAAVPGVDEDLVNAVDLAKSRLPEGLSWPDGCVG